MRSHLLSLYILLVIQCFTITVFLSSNLAPVFLWLPTLGGSILYWVGLLIFGLVKGKSQHFKRYMTCGFLYWMAWVALTACVYKVAID